MFLVKNGEELFKNELVPAQDPHFLSIDGIPQEVIDELYDDFEDVKYENYMTQKRSKKIPDTFVAEYHESGEQGTFKWFDPYTYKEKLVDGIHRKRYLIIGRKLSNNILDLLSVQEYNCIREDKQD